MTAFKNSFAIIHHAKISHSRKQQQHFTLLNWEVYWKTKILFIKMQVFIISLIVEMQLFMMWIFSETVNS